VTTYATSPVHGVADLDLHVRAVLAVADRLLGDARRGAAPERREDRVED
jgi:hypothetical protein